MVVVAMLTMGRTSGAAPPPKSTVTDPPRPQSPNKPRGGNVDIPPSMDGVQCKDNSKLHRPCDQAFKGACENEEGGEFTCNNQKCTKGTCHLPDDAED
jgi:hypothetical protein